MKPSLCLNMIVRNESARIERCLNSVLPYCKSVAILDTGSTDDTKEIIELVCAAHDVDCVVSEARFENYSQARNEAFELARRNNTGSRRCQFALLVDADMELRVTDPNAFANLDANAHSYDMKQTGGAVSYGNRRVLNLDWPKPPYLGVTHEYLDVPEAGLITGADFIDHADGANRPDKFLRDSKLLEEALQKEPNNGRYWYYLGQTYKDWGKPELAQRAFETRIAMGGWDEETFMSMWLLAGCLKAQNKIEEYLAKLVEAYNFRACRAEPLHDLAKYYREKGMNAASLVYAKLGSGIKKPDDMLFVNNFVYDYGLRYEYSIVGSYDEKERNCAFQVTDDLALDPACPDSFRKSARWNLFFHTKRLKDYCPSFVDTQLSIETPEGYTAMNPSIMNWKGNLLCLVRTVNYKMDEQGRYMIGPKECGDAPIDTRNFLCRLGAEDFKVITQAEVNWNPGAPAWDMVRGLEDMRIFERDDSIWFNACARETNAGGVCQQIFGRIELEDERDVRVSQWETMSGLATYEKNWMHWDDDKFVYRLNTIISSDGAVEKTPCDIAIAEISGSSQCIPFRAGKLAVVHEASTDPQGKRTYWHRFVWFEAGGRVRRLSLPFVFLDRQIEFCAGLAYHPNNNDLVISFGVRDAEAHLATVSIEEVARMIWKFHEN